MKPAEVRGKEDTELDFDIESLEKELFDLKFRSLTEGNANPSRIRAIRRDIARMKTVLRERQKNIRGQESR
ncbi:MAG: 50S ribosomal protein L29 [Planctomycetota bacterium]|jgi:large subunit ribosomal protein L29|nr:50S ribosomal protein L29 [Planctomycetota bacterium]MDP6941831.1 50S ribosomal protein L29 [Planctomycetota bacterium]